MRSTPTTSSVGGRPTNVIMLTIDCFKKFAVVAGTPRAKQVIEYLLSIEAELAELQPKRKKRKVEQLADNFLTPTANNCGLHDDAPIVPPSRESVIRDKIAADGNGITEVMTPFGRIDVLTPTTVIEVKKQHNWKHGMGQLFAYGVSYPDKQKQLILFDAEPGFDMDIVHLVCNKLDIEVLIWK